MKSKFDAIWEDWLYKEDFTADIERTETGRKRFHSIIKNLLNKNRNNNVLELGSGTGTDTLLLKKYIPHNHYFAMDISFTAIKVMKKIENKLFNTPIRPVYKIVGDINNLSFKKKFYLIFHQGVLEHLDEPEKIIRFQLDILQDNGYIVISVPQTFTFYTIYKHSKMLLGKWEWGYETEFSIFRIKKICKKLRLNLIDVSGEGYYPTWFDPVFVLRDLADKFLRRFNMPFLLRKLFILYNQCWEYLETRFGYLFQKEIVFLIQKKK
ncbi:MAG: class I SAM-dependent methyltransferase [Candidatus Hydrogenedentota bacterium]